MEDQAAGATKDASGATAAAATAGAAGSTGASANTLPLYNAFLAHVMALVDGSLEVPKYEDFVRQVLCIIG